jgi:hypothetical protein
MQGRRARHADRDPTALALFLSVFLASLAAPCAKAKHTPQHTPKHVPSPLATKVVRWQIYRPLPVTGLVTCFGKTLPR